MLLQVAGHSRKIGKTSLVCAILSEFRELGWTAVKISPHGHGLEEGCQIEEELVPGHYSDTSRFLAAGAARAFFLRAAQDCLAPALEALRPLVAGAGPTVIESNRVAGQLVPDLCLLLVDPAVEDWKETTFPLVEKSVIVLVDRPGAAWLDSRQRVFRLPPGQWLTPELAQFLRETVFLETPE